MEDPKALTDRSQVEINMKEIRKTNMKTRNDEKTPETINNQKGYGNTYRLKCTFCSLGILACVAFGSVLYALIWLALYR